jgi:hypothetical protein
LDDSVQVGHELGDFSVFVLAFLEPCGFHGGVPLVGLRRGLRPSRAGQPGRRFPKGRSRRGELAAGGLLFLLPFLQVLGDVRVADAFAPGGQLAAHADRRNSRLAQGAWVRIPVLVKFLGSNGGVASALDGR